MKPIIAILVVTLVLAFATLALISAVYHQQVDQFMIGKTTGNWEGQVMTSAFPYNDEYAISVMMDGDVVILTNQFVDMFDVPLTHVKFWGTIESTKPLVIHVDGIGW